MMKKVIFNDDEYKEILQELNQFMEEADTLPYPDAKELIFSILKYFDSIHREPLSRMMEMINKHYPTLRKNFEADFSVGTMLGLYDLIPQSQNAQISENGGTLGFVPVEEVTLLYTAQKKEWLALGKLEDFEEKKLYPRNFEKVNFLISKVNEEVYAIQNQCADSILPIDHGTLEGHFLICPWHGCRYNLKTGKAEGNPQKQLETYAVEIEEDGMLKVEIAY